MNDKNCSTEVSHADEECKVCGSRNTNLSQETDQQPGKKNIASDKHHENAETQNLGTSEMSEQNAIFSTSDKTTASTRHTEESMMPEAASSEISYGRQSVFGYFSRAFMSIAIMLFLSILAGTGYCIYNLSHTQSLEGQLRRANSDQATAVNTIEELNTQVSELQTDLKKAQEEKQKLSGQVDTLTGQVTTLEGEVSQYQYDASAAEQDAEYAAGEVETLNHTVTELEKDLAEANEKNDTLTSENTSLQTQKDTLAEKNDALTEENQEYAEKVAFYDQYVVFVMTDAKNKYYHTYDCSEFTKKNFLAYSVKLAQQNNYTPCPVCHPEAASTTTAARTTISITANNTAN